MSEKKTSIEGQALIEGIMMRGPVTSAMAVRLPGGDIDTETWPTNKTEALPWYKKACFIRGIFNMVDTLGTGFSCLMKSAEKAGMEEEEPTKFEKWLAKVLGASAANVMNALAVVLGVGLALLLFIVIPTSVTSLLRPVVPGERLLALIEGLLKAVIFLCYLGLSARLPDVKRLFSYHGAEHKTIACYEAGKELTVENIRGYTRFHPRCGTSFIVLVLIISILVSSFISWQSPLLRMVLKLLTLPVVIGIAYELIKLAGRYTNPLTRLISAPGLCLQRLTTAEPDDGMIEIAIAAMKPVIPEDANADNW